jgi:RNA polymerase sigma-70 factor (ECF subfamily)
LLSASARKEATLVTPTDQTIPHAGLSPRAKPTYEQIEEVELIQSCQRRDQAAFHCLFKRYERNVRGVLYRLAPELQDTSDLTQEVFIRLWTSIGKLRNPYSFRTWLSQITTNVFYDELRRRRQPTVSLDCGRYGEDGEEGPLLQIADKSPMPDELMDRTELSLVMEKALVQIPQRYRKMIVLRDVNGLSYKQIGEATHSPIGTVKSRVSRARAKMQSILLPYLCA